MKTTISTDGVIRTDITVVFRLGLEEMTMLYLAANEQAADEDINALVRTLRADTRARIMVQIRGRLRSDGQIHSMYRDFAPLQIGLIRAELEKRFPEFSLTPARKAAIEKFNLRAAK